MAGAKGIGVRLYFGTLTCQTASEGGCTDWHVYQLLEGVPASQPHQQPVPSSLGEGWDVGLLSLKMHFACSETPRGCENSAPQVSALGNRLAEALSEGWDGEQGGPQGRALLLEEAVVENPGVGKAAG